jgi:hypothetical protein
MCKDKDWNINRQMGKNGCCNIRNTADKNRECNIREMDNAYLR